MREPLPALPSITPTDTRPRKRPAGAGVVWASEPYRRDVPRLLTERLSAGPSAKHVAGDFGAMRVPGLEWKPGMGGIANQAAPVCMHLDIFKFQGDVAAQRRIFSAAQGEGWTFQFSLGDSQRMCGEPWSIGAVIELMQLWRDDYGGFCDPWFLGGGGPPRHPFAIQDGTWDQYAPTLMPWIDAMQRAGVLPQYGVGWQLDGFNRPAYLLDIKTRLRAEIDASARARTHWITDACMWWDDWKEQGPGTTEELYNVHDRFTAARFDRGDRYVGGAWRPSRDKEDGAQWEGGQWVANAGPKICDDYYLQVDVDAPLDDMQRAAAAVMASLAGDQLLIPAEYGIQDEFNEPLARLKWMTDMRGFGICNAVGPHGEDNPSQVCGGFYNGRREPDGSFA